MKMETMTAPQITQTWIVKNEWGKLVQLHVCDPGGYFIEAFNHFGDVYAGLQRINRAQAMELITSDKNTF